MLLANLVGDNVIVVDGGGVDVPIAIATGVNVDIGITIIANIATSAKNESILSMIYQLL
jgi:hypothetical protein